MSKTAATEIKTKEIYFNKAASTVIFVSGIESTIFSCALSSWQICIHDLSRQEGSRVGESSENVKTKLLQKRHEQARM